ncbi:MAG TPA: ABC transporter ATP-binding protein [Limnochordales bacterium]
MSGLRLVVQQVRGQWPALVAGTLCVAAFSAASLVLPLVVGRDLFDRVLSGGDLQQLHRLLALVAGLYLVRGIFHFGGAYLLAFAGQRATADLRARVHDHLQRLSLAYHQRQRVGDLVSRLTADLGMVQAALTPGLTELVRDLLTLVGSCAILVWVHWKLALLALTVLPVTGVVVDLYGRVIQRYAREMQARIGEVAGVLHESLSAIRIVKAFTLEEQQRRRFATSNERGFRAAMQSARAMATAFPVVEFLMLAAMAAVVYVGAREVLSGRLTTGELVAFLSYLGMLSGPVSSVGRFYTQLRQAAAAADRVAEILREPPEAVNAPGTVVLDPARVKGRVCFEHVSFRYEGSDGEALHDINLEVEPGEVVAIVGPSGAGKTTLVSLIPRFFDPTSGRVVLDGRDLRSLRLDSLRRLVAVVPQETVLLHLTVAENIALGRPGASRAETIEAARMANAHEFIQALPQGYDTVLGDLGAGLSGGQRQRIAIARAVLRDPRILILDEATSSLDPESEAAVQEALARLMRGRTTFVVAHRLSTVARADRIVVMDGGRIVEQGTHQELLAGGGLYARLFRLQALTA